MPLNRNQAYVLKTRYDAKTFRQPNYSSGIKNVDQVWSEGEIRKRRGMAEALPSDGVLSAKPGEVRVYFLAGRVS